MNKKRNVIRLKLLLFQSVWCVNALFAQDPLEYNYLFPSFPKNDTRAIDKKPQIQGWANEKVSEFLDRGAIAVKRDGGVYISWRLLKDDEAELTFNVYRSGNGKDFIKVNKLPIRNTCDFFDKEIELTSSISYQIRTTVNGKEADSYSVEILHEGYHSIKLNGDHKAERVAVADLNGDGKYDFVIKHAKQSLGGGIRGIQHVVDKDITYKLETYLHDGTFLWQIDLGLGIEPGTWYSPYVAYDLDGDGKAEVAVKTAGKDFVRDEIGRVLSGQEFISIFDGMTGKMICQDNWIPRSKRLGNYVRTNRNQMGVAFLDGKTPFLLIERGTYKAMFLEAFTFKNRKLKKYWRWDGDEENPIVRHQGAHTMHSVDVDGDGREEVVLGSAVVDDNGDLLWSTGYGHPDKCYVTDILPDRPGLEIFYSIEDTHEDGNGVCLVDAATGKTIWNIGHKTIHVGSGMVADIMPEHPGLECFAGEASKAGSTDTYMLAANGAYLARNEGVPPFNTWLFWDADLLRERVSYSKKNSTDIPIGGIEKYKGTGYPEQIAGSAILVADLFGDWREEILTALPGEIRIYSSTINAKDRRVTLMQDPVYRAGVAHFSMGYIQSPVTGYYLGE